MEDKKKNGKKKVIVVIIIIILILLLLLLLFKSYSNKQDNTNSNGNSISTQEVEENNDNNIEDDKKEESTKEEVTNDDSKKEESKQSEVSSYYVSFLNIDGTVLQKTAYKAGDIPSYKGTTPTYSDGVYSYTFIGWDKTIEKVSNIQTYTALYSKTYIKKNPKVTVPTAKTLTYTGSSQELVTKGSTDGGILKYKLNDGEYSESIPTGTNVGSYTVYYKVIGDENYNDVAEKSINVTISKIKVDVPEAITNLLYDGTEKTGVTLPSDAKYTLTSNTKTDAGDYTAIATLSDKTNYEWNISTPTSDDQSINWSIAKRKVTFYTPDQSKTYDGDVLSVTSAPLVSADCDGLLPEHAHSWSGTGSITDVGSTEATFKISAILDWMNDDYDVTSNYEITNEYGTLTVTKATTSITNLTLADWTYGETASAPSANTNFGTISYTYSDSESGTYSVTVPTNVGTYYVKASVEGTNNYNSASETKSFKINKAKVTVPTAKTGLVYSGNEQTGVELPSDAKYSLSTNKATNAGDYTATATLSDISNYEWNLDTPTTDNQSISWSIAKANQNAPAQLEVTKEDDDEIALRRITTTGYGTVQYAFGETSDGPTSIWYDSDSDQIKKIDFFDDDDWVVFNYTRNGFYRENLYYFFARYKGDENHNPSESSVGTSAATTCFVAGTKITMADDTTKNIEDIKVGDSVKSYDVLKDEFYTTTINKVWKSTNNTISTITLLDGTKIKCTPNHPICTTDGFKSVDPEFAGGLKEFSSQKMNIGDMVVTDHGIYEVASISTNVGETVSVYNLSVISNGNELNNTFIANGVVAHNKPC